MRLKKQPKKFYLDNSGIIHLAVLKAGRSNLFRFSATLKEDIKPELLQEALNIITPRFPTLVAGIRGGFYRYIVVPVGVPPMIQPDIRPLEYMPIRKIRKCAMRVLYGEREVSVEFFHSLTDGYGGLEFLKTLLSEYLRLAYGVTCSDQEALLIPDHLPKTEETLDSFLTYSEGAKKASFNKTRSYLPGQDTPKTCLHTTTGIFDVQSLLGVSHKYGVSLTTFLTAVMAKSVMEVQSIHKKLKEKHKPVQIMVPVNLRKKFPSKTLRNFSLYALPCVKHEDMKLSFEKLVQRIDHQLREQFKKDNLKSMMATNASLEKNWFLRNLPLFAKCVGLRWGYNFVGGKNSSLTLSNLGECRFPKEMQSYIKRIGVFLSARIHSPYNCGVASYDGKLYINFSRCSSVSELEPVFFKNLLKMGCVPKIEIDGMSENLEQYLETV